MLRITIQSAFLLSLFASIGACTLYSEGSGEDDPGYSNSDASNPYGDPIGDASNPWTQDAGNPWTQDAGNPWTQDAGNPWIGDAGNPWIGDAGNGNDCGFIFQEAICVVTAGCLPQYNGVNCSCDMNSCQCDSFEFQSCQ